MRKPMLQGVGIVLFFLLGSWELESGFLLENRISFYAFTHLLARNTPTDPSGRFSVFYLHSCPQARDTKIFPTAHVIQLQKGTVFRFQEMIRKKVHFKKGSTLKKKKKKSRLEFSRAESREPSVSNQHLFCSCPEVFVHFL